LDRWDVDTTYHNTSFAVLDFLIQLKAGGVKVKQKVGKTQSLLIITKLFLARLDTSIQATTLLQCRRENVRGMWTNYVKNK